VDDDVDPLLLDDARQVVSVANVALNPVERIVLAQRQWSASRAEHDHIAAAMQQLRADGLTESAGPAGYQVAHGQSLQSEPTGSCVQPVHTPRRKE
jgi:hypothetical protein